MSKKKVLYIQPFLFEEQQMTDEILIWPVYIDNFLKSRIKNLKSHLIYLPNELLKKKITIYGAGDKKKLSLLMDKILSKIDLKPDSCTMICISCTTSHHYLPSLMLIEYFNQFYPKSLIFIGGAHVSACPDDFCYKNSPVDFIIKGEGEISLYNLLKYDLRKKSSPIIIENFPVLDLNQLPPLNLSILNEYINQFKAISISLSRGCPFQCSFCMEKTLNNGMKIKLWRPYSPKRALNEVKTMISYGHENNIHEFGFYDPTFGLKKRWLEKFILDFDIEMERGWIETRIDVLNRTLLEQLKKKNFLMWYGVESFSHEMLKIMNKSHNTQRFLEIFEKIYEYHVKNNHYFNMNILCGHPGETKKTFQITFGRLIKMIENREIKLNQINIRYYHSFPGTSLYNNRDFYKKMYGTEIIFPNWWKNEDLLKYGPFCVKPSFELSTSESFNVYTEHYKELLSHCKECIKNEDFPSKFPLLIDLKKQINVLERKKEEYFEFLNDKHIEKFSPYLPIIQ